MEGEGDFKLLTLKQVADLLAISKRTLLRIIQANGVPAFRVGGQWRIRESKLKKWLEEKEGKS